MGNLLKKRANASEKAKHIKNSERRKEMVVYTLSGKAARRKLSKKLKISVIIAAGVLVVLGIVYLPPLFYRDPSDHAVGSTMIMPDASAIKTYQTYLKDHPDMDFDNDGLNNSMEEEYGTDPWKPDTDQDGVTDYAELYVTETSPTDTSNVFMKYISAEDEKNGDSINTPYKIDDIILWPDDYFSKSFGAVVRTITGYRFCNYTGWVRFPESVYAYRYKDGVHHELLHKENEDAWRIDSDDEILLYKKPLSFVHHFNVLSKTFYLEDDAFGNFVSRILPDKGGILTCYKTALIDTQPSTEKDVTARLRSPLINLEDPTRFHFNMNTLKDLSWVRNMIKDDQCIAVSLYSANVGEAVGIIYGYDPDGNLLVSDLKLNPVGTLKITEYAKRMMDKDGEISQASWYDFQGLGFDSAKYGDRISFFASTITGTEVSNTPPSAGNVQAQNKQEETQNAGAALDTTQAQNSEVKEIEITPTPDIPEQNPPETEAVQQVPTFGF